jgi:cell shape-determining protein MreD
MRIFILILLSLAIFFCALLSEKIHLFGGISFKPIIIFLYFITLYWNTYYALFIGFFLGILYEVYLPVLTGTYSLIFTSCVIFLKIVEKKIFKFRYNSLFLLFMILLFVGLIQVIIEVAKIGRIFNIIFTNLIPEAILNTLVGFVILYFVKRVSRSNVK